jgi:sugar phosphate isomerase/epimerase
MAPRFSLAHLTALGCAPPELTYIAARAGYDFVSPRIIMTGTPNEVGYNYALAEDPVLLRQTKRALADTGLTVHDIELIRISDGVEVKSLLPAFEVAAELGAHHVLSSIWTPNRSFAIECFAELCDLARPFGLKISLEFVTWAEVVNLREVIEVLRAADRDNAGISIDLLHFHRSRVPLDELAQVPPDLFTFVHLCDAPGEIPQTKEGLIYTGRAERLYPGEGGIDIAAILTRMPEVPYSIEIPHLARVKELGYAEHARRCLESSKAYFASHLMDSPALSAPHAALGA